MMQAFRKEWTEPTSQALPQTLTTRELDALEAMGEACDTEEQYERARVEWRALVGLSGFHVVDYGADTVWLVRRNADSVEVIVDRDDSLPPETAWGRALYSKHPREAFETWERGDLEAFHDVPLCCAYFGMAREVLGIE